MYMYIPLKHSGSVDLREMYIMECDADFAAPNSGHLGPMILVTSS